MNRDAGRYGDTDEQRTGDPRQRIADSQAAARSQRQGRKPGDNVMPGAMTGYGRGRDDDQNEHE